jgi:hypothetical protein
VRPFDRSRYSRPSRRRCARSLADRDAGVVRQLRRSFGQLLAGALGALATLLPLLHQQGDLAAIIEALGKLVGHASGN